MYFKNKEEIHTVLCLKIKFKASSFNVPPVNSGLNVFKGERIKYFAKLIKLFLKIRFLETDVKRRKNYFDKINHT